MTHPLVTDRSEFITWSRSGFWKAFIVVLGAIVVLVGIVNLIVDPLELYGTDLFSPWQFNRYERKLELFRKFNPPARALILGSSRVESMDPELVEEITGKRCFNWGLPSASAETMLAVLRLAVEECEAPIELVIVGIEPVAFHPSLWVHPQARLVPAYTKYFADAPQMVSLKEKLSRLLTFEQTRTSYMVLRRETGIDEPQKRVEYRNDGRAIYYQREEAIAAGTFDLEEILQARVPYYPEESLGLSTFSGLSEARKRSWEEFLSLCDEKGVRICVFLPPVHPELWSLLEREGAEPIHSDVADYVSVTVSEAGGVFRDYRLLESFGGNPDLFYDEVHMQPGNVEILLRDLLADDGSQAGEDR